MISMGLQYVYLVLKVFPSVRNFRDGPKTLLSIY